MSNIYIAQERTASATEVGVTEWINVDEFSTRADAKTCLIEAESDMLQFIKGQPNKEWRARLRAAMGYRVIVKTTNRG